MSGRTERDGRWWHNAAVLRLLRCLLGAWFIYMGLTKALHPVEFLKAVREYHFFEHHLALNFVAGTLPWFEVYCGVLLLGGVAVAGTAASLLVLLLAFTTLVIGRAWSVHSLQSIPFCAVRFDCGCGTGEVLICRKVLENAGLIALTAFVLMTSRGVRSQSLFRRRAPTIRSVSAQ